MGYISSLGKNTKTIIYASEGDKLSVEFTVAASNTVKIGQPVKLNAAGEVLPWATADGDALIIGFAMTDQAAGELVTVWTRGYMLIFAITAGAVNAGPVTYSTYDTSTDINGTTGYPVVATSTPSSGVAPGMIGWALDLADGANDMLRILLKN